MNFKTPQDFDLFIVETRNRFVDKINEQEWRTELRMEAENLLLAYDQMREKISQFPSPQEVTDEESGLKPCPFCGSKELAVTSHPSKDGTVIFYTIHHLAHTPCGIELMTTNRENLITQWNLRSKLTNNQNL